MCNSHLRSGARCRPLSVVDRRTPPYFEEIRIENIGNTRREDDGLRQAAASPRPSAVAAACSASAPLLRAVAAIVIACLLPVLSGFAQPLTKLYMPYLEVEAVVDGDLSEWKDYAFNDGVWDINRLRHAPWYDEGRRNRLTDHGDEPRPEDDLRARYYMAWDDDYLYLGAEVVDNVNDVDDPAPADHRWYYKDSICWFIEAPRDDAPEWFGRGDNALCFVIDADRPSYAAWWRHGAPGETYIEEPMPPGSFEYEIRFDPWGTGPADYVLEARVTMAPMFSVSDPSWRPPQVGDEYGLNIVHCDPDGGDYGGHFMVYGDGDNDATWSRLILVGPQEPIDRLPE